VPGRKALILQLNTVNTAQRRPGCRYNVLFRAGESLSDNIQKGTLKDKMIVTRGSASMLEDEEEEEEKE
jgi:hypothetical protein